MNQTKAPLLDQYSYEFPLENGESAYLYVPKNITRSDIKRLTHMLTALVMEQEVKELGE